MEFLYAVCIPVFLAGIGGSMGAVSRYYLDAVIKNNIGGKTSQLPPSTHKDHIHIVGQALGIIVVNVTGCFLAGMAHELVHGTVWLALISTGFLGGYTTFSTAMTDIWAIFLLKPGGSPTHAKSFTVGVLVALVTLLVCVCAAWLGFGVAGWLFPN